MTLKTPKPRMNGQTTPSLTRHSSSSGRTPCSAQRITPCQQGLGETKRPPVHMVKAKNQLSRRSKKSCDKKGMHRRKYQFGAAHSATPLPAPVPPGGEPKVNTPMLLEVLERYVYNLAAETMNKKAVLYKLVTNLATSNAEISNTIK